MTRGWYGDRHKHSLASRGIKSTLKSRGFPDIPEDDLIDQLFGTKVVSKFHRRTKDPTDSHTLETIWEDVSMSENEIAWLVENGYMPRTQGVGAFMKINVGDNIHMIPKELDYIGTMGDLLKISDDFHIASATTGEKVRHITKDGDYINLETGDPREPVFKFHKNTPVFYEEWFMDRGSYLIWIEELNQFGKLATEYDRVVR